jgi:hypothetical protein
MGVVGKGVIALRVVLGGAQEESNYRLRDSILQVISPLGVLLADASGSLLGLPVLGREPHDPTIAKAPRAESEGLSSHGTTPKELGRV